MQYPTTGLKDGSLIQYRFGYRNEKDDADNPNAFPPSLREFHDKWSAKFNGGIQFTFQEGDPFLPPWELPVLGHFKG